MEHGNTGGLNWIDQFDLFLFDFDGLLVNTEELHWTAYKELCRNHGIELEWSLNQFFEHAHLSAEGIQKALYPRFFKGEVWGDLYAEKKEIYQSLLKKGHLTLMKGAESVLKALEQANKKRCVVTHSPKASVDLIKNKLGVLQTIPHWFTRESYRELKPHPDGYLTALKALAEPGDRVIGFEDSVRGLTALKRAGVQIALLVCPPDHPQLGPPLSFYPSLLDIELG